MKKILQHLKTVSMVIGGAYIVSELARLKVTYRYKCPKCSSYVEKKGEFCRRCKIKADYYF